MNTTTLKRKFSIERTALLIRNRALEDLPTVLIGMGLLLGINLFSIIVTRRAMFNDGSGQVWTFSLFGSGLLFASYAFKGMHDGKAGLDWVLLPASSLEKYLAALIEYVILYPLVGAVATLGLSALLSLFETMAGGSGGRIWMPGIKDLLRAWCEYAIVALWFLAGSAAFRRRPLLKSSGILMLYVLLMSSALFLLMHVSAQYAPNGLGYGGGFSFSFDGWSSYVSRPLPESAQSALTIVFDVLRYAIVPIFSVGYGYLRVAEKEVRDEVQ